MLTSLRNRVLVAALLLVVGLAARAQPVQQCPPVSFNPMCLPPLTCPPNPAILTATSAKIGTTWSATIDPCNANLALVFLSPGGLIIPPTPFGNYGNLLLNPGFLFRFFTVPSGGVASVSSGIPNDPMLIGFPYAVQGFCEGSLTNGLFGLVCGC